MNAQAKTEKTLAQITHQLMGKGLQKHTKVSAFQSVNEIWKALNAEQRRDLATTMAEIYAYLMPKTTTEKSIKAAKSDVFAWVAMAAGKKDVRYYLNNVWATGTHIVATDGHRMHYANDTRPAGWYCQKTGELLALQGSVEAIDMGKFPDWQRVIPKSTHVDAYADISETVAPESHSYGPKYQFLQLMKGDNMLVTVNEKYLREALARFVGYKGVTIGHTDQSTAIMIQSSDGDCCAVVMPIKI